MTAGRGVAYPPGTPSESSTTARRPPGRFVLLDRSLEVLPVFRLSDSSEESAIVFAPNAGGRWRVLPSPGDRLPGTFDQDVYIELFRRYHETGMPSDGVISFTLHAFLRSMGRRADGRTYEQLRSALNRLERTTVESTGAYWSATSATTLDLRFSLLSGVSIDRRRMSDREQIPLFPSVTAFEPGDARVTISPSLRANIGAGHVTMLSAAQYFALSSPVARRLYRLLEVARAEGSVGWRLPLGQLAERIPLTQRYPSHLQRVLQPANEMLLSAGIVRVAEFRQIQREWVADYVLAARGK
jgi:plasmid replication initiation protein